jgi:uncharacterized membrane protein
MEFWRLLAHNHWITIKVIGREVRLCARCSGYAAGIIAATALHRLKSPASFQKLPVNIQFSVCLAMLLPLAVDWITQSWGWRESNNSLRFLTGTVLGYGVFLFSLVDLTHSMRKSFFVLTAVTIVCIGLVEDITGSLLRARIP